MIKLLKRNEGYNLQLIVKQLNNPRFYHSVLYDNQLEICLYNRYSLLSSYADYFKNRDIYHISWVLKQNEQR